MFACMGTLVVILVDPSIQILLKLFQGRVDLLPESDGIELILDGSMEAFTDPVSLRRPGLRPSVIDVLQSQIKLIFVMFPGSTVFGSPVGKVTEQRDLMLLKKRDYPVIKDISCH